MTGDALQPGDGFIRVCHGGRFCARRANINLGGSVDRKGRHMMNLGYILIPVVLFVGGMLVSTALFNLGMKRILEK